MPNKLFSFCAIDYYCERHALIANANNIVLTKKEIFETAQEVAFSADEGFGGFSHDDRRVYAAAPKLDKSEPASTREESALLASETYMGQSRGIEISAMQDDEVKAILPELEMQFHVSQEQTGTLPSDKVQESDVLDYYTGSVGQKEAGMDLVQAYLKLGKKDQAIEVLHKLAGNNDNPDFREFCQKMLEILE